MNRPAAILALASAALFGVSTPVAKALLHTTNPAILAGLLYCGAGIGVAILRRIAPALNLVASAPQVPLGAADLRWLAAAIAVGGVVGPLLLMLGLTGTTASTASLLLVLEGAATAIIAWTLFGEGFDRRILLGMACLIAGALVLSWSDTPKFEGLAGPLAIVAACVAWGFDNNFTRRVSLSDPLQIVELKGLIAGPISIVVGLWSGGMLSVSPNLILAAVTGFFGYGVSLALFVVALRHLGAARTGAYFSVAPFLGAIASVLFFGDDLTVRLLAAGGLMGVGVWLHLSEQHVHDHLHEPLDHAHPHSHDEHHDHEHDPRVALAEPHTHRHRHRSLRHVHAHAPDMHHIHRH